VDAEELAELKNGMVAHEGGLKKMVDESFTPYYESPVPWLNRLWKAVFPNGGRWEKEDTCMIPG
jgi:hypothetical protein